MPDGDIWHVVAHSVHNLAQKTIEPADESIHQSELRSEKRYKLSISYLQELRRSLYNLSPIQYTVDFGMDIT